MVFRDLGRDYARTINKTYRRSGTLWEGRFKSSLVDKARYCLTCHRYIELNPVRAGMVSHPADYPWSSFRYHAMGEADAMITPHDCWLNLGKDDQARRAAYRALFNERMTRSDVDSIRQSINTGLPTGNDRFRREIEQALSVKMGHGTRGRPRKPKG